MTNVLKRLALLALIAASTAAQTGPLKPVQLPSQRAAQLRQLDDEMNATIEQYKLRRLVIIERAALEANLTAAQLDALDGPFEVPGTGGYEWRPKQSPSPRKEESERIKP